MTVPAAGSSDSTKDPRYYREWRVPANEDAFTVAHVMHLLDLLAAAEAELETVKAKLAEIRELDLDPCFECANAERLEAALSERQPT